MSRLVVKNLPNGITEARLRNIFEAKGTITDLSLKFTKDGVFRKLAFIGFLNEEQAEEAKSYFDRTFIDTSRIQVEACRPLGDAEKPRSWSQHSVDSSRFQKNQPKKPAANKNDKPDPKAEREKKKALDKFDQLMRNPLLTDEEKAMLETVKDSPEFKEFLKVQRNKSVRNLWDNDELGVAETEEIEDKKKKSQEVEEEKEDPENKKEDFDKMKYTVKMKRLPKGVNKANLRDFFKPLDPKRVFLPKKAKDIAFVQFANSADVFEALKNDKKDFLGRSVHIVKCQYDESEELSTNQNGAAIANNQDGDNDDSVADHGRLFIRNLCFSCTQEDLEKLFGKYGPIAEVHLPTDFVTKRGIGYGYVTFVMPEHAVKAMNALDGKDFQGRMLHIIPSKPKPEVVMENSADAKSSFKKEKESKQKSESQKAGNWNTLFLGASAVVDVMAQRYKVSKTDILDADNTKQSVAVRVALGETQLVNETKEFLESNGVKLDVFNSTNHPRSKTVIIAKNLPAGTLPTTLMDLFKIHGNVARVILPPAGITALIEMVDPTEAKKAFKALAYSKFGKVPLYLEWAPMDALQPSIQQPQKTTEDAVKMNPQQANQKEAETDSTHQTDHKATEEMDEPSEPGCTLFVKGLNFETTDETLRQFFARIGPLKSAAVARKKDTRRPDGLASMGYGFVEYKKSEHAKEALKRLQHAELDGFRLEVKMSERTLRAEQVINGRKSTKPGEPVSAKIIVRNLAFQASEKEVRDIFKVFGELKSVRLPRKMGDTGSHRGFCFVEYHTKADAKKAFDALSASTHLYNRRLVLEWAKTDDQDVDVLRNKVAHDFSADEPSKKKLKKRSLMEDLDRSNNTEMDMD